MSLQNLVLLFIDTSSFPSPSSTSQNTDLPLLDTLPVEIQTSVLRYLRPPDRRMSLASALLKYWFIHRSTKIPWEEVVISRTPAPHKRPWWDPETSTTVQDRKPEDRFGLEFNVSHQAGLVGLIGAAIPPGTMPPLTTSSASTTGKSQSGSHTKYSGQTESQPTPTPWSMPGSSPSLGSPRSNISSSLVPTSPLRLGLDITSSTEANRTPNISTQKELEDYVSIFSEVFSQSDIEDMKYSPLQPSSALSTSDPVTSPPAAQKAILAHKLKRFYTFFALKEAYVKMTGEALLADWLRDISFRNVRVPALDQNSNDCSEYSSSPLNAYSATPATAPLANEEMDKLRWTKPYTQTQVYLKSTHLSQVKLVTRGLEPDGFLVAVAVDGVADESLRRSLDGLGNRGEKEHEEHGEVQEDGGQWRFLDWRRDIEDCARGRCHCLG